MRIRRVPSPSDPNERRLSSRLPITEAVRYKTRVAGRQKGVEQTGSGTTVNMSSRGVLFTTDCFLAEGSRVELAVNWPVALDGVALKLVVLGRVIRAETALAAMSIEEYEFKTRGAGLSSAVALSRVS